MRTRIGAGRGHPPIGRVLSAGINVVGRGAAAIVVPLVTYAMTDTAGFGKLRDPTSFTNETL